jgi:hypothetical protein
MKGGTWSGIGDLSAGARWHLSIKEVVDEFNKPLIEE